MGVCLLNSLCLVEFQIQNSSGPGNLVPIYLTSMWSVPEATGAEGYTRLRYHMQSA